MNKPIIIRGNKPHKTSKNVLYSRNCNNCKKHYIGWGMFYCCNKCRIMPKGKESPSWKGDNIKPQSGRTRASKIFKLKPCEICGSKKSERHHIDNNPINNVPENIMFVCRKHHMHIDRRPWEMVKARLASNPNPS